MLTHISTFYPLCSSPGLIKDMQFGAIVTKMPQIKPKALKFFLFKSLKPLTELTKLFIFNMGQPWPLFDLLIEKLFTTMIKDRYQLETLMHRWQFVFAFWLISADWRESWVGIAVASWLYKTERLSS